MSVTEKVLDAIQLLATNSVEKAGYDKTIQAQIISCEDATIGKYRCRYQDAIIYAYSNNPNITFNNGSYVYILVPSNDMKKEKTILGTTQKLGINYISQAEGDQAYDIIGNNCITSNNIFYLNTNNKNYTYALYRHGVTSEVTFDSTALNQYIKQSSSLIVGATFKTSIPLERQYRGNYGIIYNLRFLDNTSNKQVIRSYIVDEDNMIDNPYKLIYETRQYQIFDIDGPNFIRVESIEIFNKDFPNATGSTTGGKLSSGDIQITTLQFFGATRMSNDEINGVAISFYTPQGTFFSPSSTAASYKTITAQVRVKGKLASSDQNIPFYWGFENTGILPNSQYYNKYLGKGWKCLNNSNVVVDATESTESVIEWVPGKDTHIIKFPQATARDNRFKVAIVYDGNVITKEINIQNLSVNIPILTIESNSGTKFYYDIGHPTLVCKVNGSEFNNYRYYWAYESGTGIFTELSETTTQNTQYASAVAALNNLKSAIAGGTKFAKAEATNLTNLEANVKAFDFIQRVQGNKVYNVQINNITNFGIFKCSVYNNNNVYLGTASITLTNSLDGEGLYSLVINNGSMTFQYNENGIAPNNKSLDTQQQIQGLSFTIYDNLGQPIDSDIIANTKNCFIRWQFPIQDSMLVDSGNNGTSSGTDSTGNYRYYDNITNLIYGIAQKYDIQKQRNQIKLTVSYKTMNLTAETEFTFAKQGEPGTNGTQYLVKLVPNTRMTIPPLWPMITKAGSSYVLNYGINTTSSEQTIGAGTGYQLFKAQLWHNGELVWEGASASTAAIDGVTKPSAVNWEVLKNKYNSTASDDSAFNVTNAATGLISYSGDHLESALATPLANIIKCSITWQNKLYYGTIPITTAWTSNANYRVSLKDYTGFRYAIYTSDGMIPQYDSSHPFEFICLEKINNVWEDVSMISGTHGITYTVSAVGNTKAMSNGAVSNANLLEILTTSTYRQGCQKNQYICRPASRYDGICVNTAICCIYRQNNTIIGRINVPIHYLLNKYGLSYINQWDGNSIQLDDQGGFILAPQMGAGRKENDNSFTGVVMGEVKTAGQNNSNIGLFGYSSGNRSFFLNSENGAALFGKAGKGQIALDPSSEKALLYSSNYWKTYNTATGLPSNYNSSNKNNQGLLIDLTTPSIEYGNGNFKVDSNGKLTAKEATINGSITATSLTLVDDAKQYIDDYIGQKIPPSSDMSYYVYVGNDGKIDIRKNNGVATAGTYGQGTEGFQISKSGLLQASNAVIRGTIYASSGLIGGWQIGNIKNYEKDGSLFYGTFGNQGSIYLIPKGSTNATTIASRSGTDWVLTAGNSFGVTKNGALYAISGEVGGWSITSTSISKSVTINNITYTPTLSAPRSGISTTTQVFSVKRKEGNVTTQPFVVKYDGSFIATAADITGAIKATSGTIGAANTSKKITIGGNATNAYIYQGISDITQTASSGFYIGSDGIAIGKGAFKVTADGTASFKGSITASAGYIGGNSGWKIESQKLTSGTLGTSSSMHLGTTNLGSATIADHSDTAWRFVVGSNFGVTNLGSLYAKEATIKGSITANGGYIGGNSGWKIESQKITNGTIGSNGSMHLGTTNLGTATIADHSDSTWRLTVGSSFGVTSSGVLYAKGATVIGTITAGAGKIANFSITENALYSGEHSAWNSNKPGIYISSLVSDSTSTVALSIGEKGKFYVTRNGVPYCKGTALYIDTPDGYDSGSNFTSLQLKFNGDSIAALKVSSNSCDLQAKSNCSLYLRGGSSVIEILNDSTIDIIASSKPFTISCSKMNIEDTKEVNLIKYIDNDTVAYTVTSSLFTLRYGSYTRAGIYIVEYGAKNNSGEHVKTPLGEWLIALDDEAYVYMPQVRNKQSSSSTANVRIESNNRLVQTGSSSIRYKHDIKLLENAMDVLNIPVVSFKYNEDYLRKDDQRYNTSIPGFIAQDVAKYYPIAADIEDGKVQDWNVRYIVPPMLAVEQNHEKRIAQLEEENKQLYKIINELKGDKSNYEKY